MAVATAATFVWLGMVLAISFLEAPLKFRAPGVTTVIGLGIGRLVFRALNVAEVVLAVVVVVAGVLAGVPTGQGVAIGVLVVVLLAELVLVRPRLNRRSDRVLAGETLPRSRLHLAYIGLEGVKVAALVVLGVLLLA
ncbi:MAG: Putative transmembrane protein [uncultured Actinomycetospora sp.]|uniref:Transmembrane protein n=1 Tax=uncultured Actinomycetospora sp. TaxID=1135996 RepID=A0A6J4JSP3_9PSEU|nr:MAG: Putative transmembrane protein [uncultured Actinomycetospora sp.]